MDLMTLAAKIELDDSSYTKGVGKAEKLGQQLAGKMNSMTVAVGNLTADMIRKGVNGVQQIIGGAIDGYANYQQLIGGVETLFKTSSDKVAAYAKKSFQTTGLSANAYMETVTSFSASLIQGLSGDTAQAAELANMAVTDMADNANKMGTDMASVQAAYQGFAKGNFTLLDNLKLGYGGTRGEMVRLINDSGILENEIKDLDGITFDQLVKAIHKIQTELGITGTTAAEARDTISGSKASLKAAWEDMLSAAGGKNDEEFYASLEHYKEAFSTYMTNFIPSLVLSVKSSGDLGTAIAEAVADLPENLLAQIGEAGLQSGTSMFGAASTFTHWLIESITNVFKSASADPSSIQEFGAAVGEFIGSGVKDIVINAPAVLQGLFDAGIALAEGLGEGIWEGLFGKQSQVDKIAQEMKEEITNVDLDSAKAGGLISYIAELSEKYGDAVKGKDEFQWALAELETVLPGAGLVYEQYGDDIQGATDKLNALVAAMRKSSIMAGMTKALNAQYELLGEQQTTKAQAEISAESFRVEQAGLQTVIRESAKAYAEEFVNQNREAAKEDDWTAYNVQQAEEFIKAIENNTISNEDILDNAKSYGELVTGEPGKNVWDKSLGDNIIDPNELSAFGTRIAELQNGIDDSMQAAADAQNEINATQQQINLTEAAVNAAMEESFTGAANDAASGGAEVRQALSGVADAIRSIEIPTFWSGIWGRQHATGLENVPFNGYRAELHKGEAVLDKGEAEAYRSGRGMSADEFATAMEDVLVDALSRVGIYVGKDRLGDVVSSRVAGNITVSDRARQRSMGGPA